MSSKKELAFISIQVLNEPEPAFSPANIDWKCITGLSVTAFDFDNYSEPHIIDLAIRLMERSSSVFINLDIAREAEKLTGIHRFCNAVVRRHKAKSRISYNHDHKKLKPYLQVLNARRYSSGSELKTAVSAWAKEC